MPSSLALLIAAVLLAACAGPAPRPADEAPVRVYKSAGSRQCSGGGQSLAEMRGQLESAGLRVLSATCGADGRARMAMCGAADGRIGILEIPAAQADTAAALGYAPLERLPEAAALPCPRSAP